MNPTTQYMPRDNSLRWRDIPPTACGYVTAEDLGCPFVTFCTSKFKVPAETAALTHAKRNYLVLYLAFFFGIHRNSNEDMGNT
jgi:hypothetical protein